MARRGARGKTANGSRLGLNLFDCLGSIDPFWFDELKVNPKPPGKVKNKLCSD